MVGNFLNFLHNRVDLHLLLSQIGVVGYCLTLASRFQEKHQEFQTLATPRSLVGNEPHSESNSPSWYSTCTTFGYFCSLPEKPWSSCKSGTKRSTGPLPIDRQKWPEITPTSADPKPNSSENTAEYQTGVCPGFGRPLFALKLRGRPTPGGWLKPLTPALGSTSDTFDKQWSCNTGA